MVSKKVDKNYLDDSEGTQRSTQAAHLRGSKLGGTTRHHLPKASRGLKSPSLGSCELRPPINDRLRAGFPSPEGCASGSPCGVGATTPESPDSSDACLPAPTSGARLALAARKGATATGLSRGRPDATPFIEERHLSRELSPVRAEIQGATPVPNIARRRVASQDLKHLLQISGASSVS